MKSINILSGCKKFLTKQKEKDAIFEVTYLYHGYAPEIKKAKLLAEMEERKKLLEQISNAQPILSLEIGCKHSLLNN